MGFSALEAAQHLRELAVLTASVADAVEGWNAGDMPFIDVDAALVEVPSCVGPAVPPLNGTMARSVSPVATTHTARTPETFEPVLMPPLTTTSTTPLRFQILISKEK